MSATHHQREKDIPSPHGLHADLVLSAAQHATKPRSHQQKSTNVDGHRKHSTEQATTNVSTTHTARAPAARTLPAIVEESDVAAISMAAELSAYVRGLYAREELADLAFAVSNAAAHQALVSTFRVHRLVICARCPALAELISAQPREDTLRIENTEPAAFGTLIEYLYRGEVQLTLDTALEVFVTANRFRVQLLEQHCVQFLSENVNSQSCVSLLEVALSLGSDDLKSAALKAIARHFDEVCRSSNCFEAFSTSVVLDIFREQSQYPLHFAVLQGREDVVAHLLSPAGAALVDAQHGDVNSKNDDRETPLLLALRHHRTSILDLLLKHQANVNARCRKGNTLLHQCLLENNEEGARFLIQHSARLDEDNQVGDMPLHLAIRAGFPSIVKLLLEKGSPLNHQGKNGESPLQEMIELLLAQPNVDLTLRNYQGFTPLCVSLQNGKFDLATKFIAGGADVNQETGLDSSGNTLLLSAIANKQADCARYLIDVKAVTNCVNAKQESPLLLACQNGLEEIVRLLIAKGADVSRKDSHGKTVLHLAVESGQNPIVHALLASLTSDHQKQAMFTALDDENRTPLRTAIACKNFEITKALLEHGANVNEVDHQGNSLLHQALLQGEEECAVFLVGVGSNCVSENRDHQTPVSLAVSRGHLLTLGALLDADRLIAMRQHTDGSLLRLALKNQQYAAAKMLLAAGVNVDQDEDTTTSDSILHLAIKEHDIGAVEFLLRESKANRGRENNAGDTPLHTAVRCDFKEGVALLLKPPVFLNVQNRRSQQTALHVAVEEGNLAMIELLLRHKPDLEAVDATGRTAFVIAMLQASVDVGSRLVKAGCDKELVDPSGKSLLFHAVEQKDLDRVTYLCRFKVNLDCIEHKYKRSPLHVAMKASEVGIVRALLRHSPNVYARDGRGRTPIWEAASGGSHECLVLLKEVYRDLNIETPDSSGDTPLHVAVKHNHERVVALLLQFGANVMARDQQHRTPLHLCALYCYKVSIARLLLKAKAVIDAQDSTGCTPLHLATGTFNEGVALLLVQAGASVCLPNRENLTPIDEANFRPDPKVCASPSAEWNGFLRRLLQSICNEPAWLPDSLAPQCQLCGVKFTLATRRHHCRYCGRVVCSKCSEKNIVIPVFRLEEEVRVDRLCYEILSAPVALAGQTRSSRQTTSRTPSGVASSGAASSRPYIPPTAYTPGRAQTSSASAHTASSISSVPPGAAASSAARLTSPADAVDSGMVYKPKKGAVYRPKQGAYTGPPRRT
eukprot:CAMPEP_0177642866 /NCGR_PEP_ID=MMETSP0447-20121125/7847_1 /TAXON_ID=0 /ORGANISM="Stygamoeba regulata, Strain BSH-02190019" /LENGTH=1254 /DNA_ID=CAMNT_0019145117 /DNA_START=57 /DNA_END=3822 /DNA_ORIENTATION=+